MALSAGGCDKVNELKQAVLDKAAGAKDVARSAETAKKPEKTGDFAENEPAAVVDPAPAAADAPTGAEQGDKTGGGDYDLALLKQLDAVADCERVRRAECPVYATLEDDCKAAYSAADDHPKTYARTWRTLIQGAATAKHRNARYAAVYLAHFFCQPTRALRSDEAQGRKLLAALKREGKEGYTASRMAELMSQWWRADLPKLHAEMNALLRDKTHKVPDARKELARLGGFYAAKQPALARAIIAVALADGDDLNVRRSATSHLWRIAKGQVQAKEALAALVTIAAGAPSSLSSPAFAGLGYAAAVVEWPALVARWRKDKSEPLIGAAMAMAAYRYMGAKYPSEEVAIPQRIAAYDVAEELMKVTMISASGRTWALYAIGDSGHPGAKRLLTGIAKGADSALAKEAKDVLARLKPVNPAMVAALKGHHGKRAAKRRRPSHGRAHGRGRRRPVQRPHVTRPGR